MRVVVAPDKFAGTLTARQAATAIAEGWRRRAPGDRLDEVPMSDGGPGFLDVLHAASGGELSVYSVRGPYGDPVSASVLRVDETAYLESAQAIGLELGFEGERRAEQGSTFGLGQLLAHAADDGAKRIVVGLGGSATNDAGAGMLGALGATGSGGELDGGARGLATLNGLELEPARRQLEGVELVAATDVESPLLGLTGATKTFGPQKGLAEDRLVEVDGWLRRFAELTDRRLADVRGAGAAGGTAFGLLLLGGTIVSGIDLVAGAMGLRERIDGADLVVTGEGAFDFSSGAGKVPYGVARLAADALVPCIALAGQVLVGSREMRALGVESAYSMVDLVGHEAARGRPAESLSDLAERVARTWSFSPWNVASKRPE